MSSPLTALQKQSFIRFLNPLANIQWKSIWQLLALVNLSGILLTLLIFAVFYFRLSVDTVVEGLESTGVTSQALLQALWQENLMKVIAPAFVIADVVSLMVGLGLSYYFSKKVAAPIEEVGEWAQVVSSGDLTYKIKFRSGENLQALEKACNQVTEAYATAIEDLKRQITEANIPLAKTALPIRTRMQKSLP